MEQQVGPTSCWLKCAGSLWKRKSDSEGYGLNHAGSPGLTQIYIMVQVEISGRNTCSISHKVCLSYVFN